MSNALKKPEISLIPDNVQTIAAELQENGFVFVPAAHMQKLMSPEALSAWNDYVQSWDDLRLDSHMADGGLYRRRRHASFDGNFVLQPHRPHYQSLTHNHLNGGIKRSFEPVARATLESPAHRAVMEISRTIFAEAGSAPIPEESLIEMHQFRIEPPVGSIGKPTPEGKHRDGVDWVTVTLANRINVAEGVTDIYCAKTGESLGSFTLTHPLDTVFIDDHRVLHDVTPIIRLDEARPGHRDALVLTFKAS